MPMVFQKLFHILALSCATFGVFNPHNEVGMFAALPIQDPPTQIKTQITRFNAEVDELLKAGRANDALPKAEEALTLSEKHFGPEHPDTAIALDGLGRVHLGKGSFAAAEPLLVRALAIREKTPGPEHPDTGLSLLHLGWVYQEKGDLARAEPLFTRALAVMEKAQGLEHKDVATILNNLAWVSYLKADLVRSEALNLRALTIREKMSGPEHEDTAQSLNALGLVYQARGEYARAESFLKRALKIREKSPGPEHPDTSQSLNNLALLYFVQSDFIQAEPLYLRALANYEKVLGPEHPDTARTLQNLAGLYQAREDFTRAEPLFVRALAIREKTLGPEHPVTAITVNNLALMYHARRQPELLDKAESLYLRAIAIREKTLGPEHPLTALMSINLGGLYSTRKEFARAEPVLLKALAILEKTIGPNHPETATLLSNLAWLYKNTGNFSKAESALQRAIGIMEKTLGTEHPSVAFLLNMLSGLYESEGDFAKAVTFQIKANNLRERDLMLNLASGSEQQKLLYLNRTTPEMSRCVSLHVNGAPRDAAASRLALEVILRRKGRVLDAMTSTISLLRKRGDVPTQQLLDEYSTVNAQLSALILRGAGRRKPEEYQAQIQELETRKEQLERDISARSIEFKIQTTPTTLEAVQQAIPKDAALIEYIAYQPFDAKTYLYREDFRFAVYVLKADGELTWADLGEAEPIGQVVTEFRKVVRDPKSSSADLKSKARVLDQLVMAPVRKLLGKTRRLLISPDGDLNLIPFDALVDEQGKYLVEAYEISYLTSGRDLLRLHNGLSNKTGPLVLANPDYATGAGPTVFGQTVKPLLPLPGTSREAAAIQAEFPQAIVKVKDKAAEQTLKTANRPLFLHIATHGYFLADVETPIIVEGRQGELPTPVDPEELKKANPLLRSMLFFAGANAGKGSDDGTLTALEAGSLDLWGTKLVVLSACDTGVGDVKTGDGVYGLRRAFVLAGAESQMMSLWPVSDAGTQDLMTDYYQRLKLGQGRSAALREVRLDLLKNPKRQHPFYWASFILSGEWTSLTDR